MSNSKSILKWAGGKSYLLDKIREKLESIPVSDVTFYDVFSGAGSVSFEFTDLFEKIVMNDVNWELTNVFNILKSNPTDLIEILKKYRDEHLKDKHTFYYSIREQDRHDTFSNLSNIQKAARTIYLNKTCYNGLYRVNKKGQFNVPIGRQKTLRIYNEEQFLDIHNKLQKIEIQNHDYNVVIKKCKPGDVVYFDPPYDKENKKSFVEYNTKIFDMYDQERLHEDIKDLTDRGVYVIFSNSATKKMLELYKDFIDKSSIVKVQRNIGSKNKSRIKVDEILADNFRMVNKNVDNKAKREK